MPLFKGMFEVSDELITDLRSRFLEELNTDPEAEDKYHPNDVQQVKENDWYVARYLLHQQLNVENALNMMKKSLQFRNEMNINTLKKEDFPQCFFESRLAQIYNHDKKNYPILAFRGKMYEKNAKLTRLYHQFFLYWVEKAVEISDKDIITVLFDLTDTGYKNMDVDIVRFLTNIFKHYYPWTMCAFIVYNMPWYCSAIWAIAKTWIPERFSARIKLVDNNSILEYIDKDKLPICMGGTCTDPYETDPNLLEKLRNDGFIS